MAYIRKTVAKRVPSGMFEGAQIVKQTESELLIRLEDGRIMRRVQSPWARDPRWSELKFVSLGRINRIQTETQWSGGTNTPSRYLTQCLAEALAYIDRYHKEGRINIKEMARVLQVERTRIYDRFIGPGRRLGYLEKEKYKVTDDGREWYESTLKTIRPNPRESQAPDTDTGPAILERDSLNRAGGCSGS